MPQRLRFGDFRSSRVAQALVRCANDKGTLAAIVNSAQQRLLNARESGDEGWLGTWAEMVFNVDTTTSFITTPRGIARLENLAFCKHLVPVQNQFYEYLEFGAGPQPSRRWPNYGILQAYSRNNAVSFVDPPTGTFYIRIYTTDPLDLDARLRVLVQGLDQNGRNIRSFEVDNPVDGVYVEMAAPFVQTPMTLSKLTGLQKDPTVGVLLIYSVNPETGDETLILTMEPSEETASYRRYYLGTNRTCLCGNPAQVTAMAALDFIPAQYDQDYLIIGNLEALVNECQAVRYSMMDSPGAKQFEQYHHKQAIGLLNGELIRNLGKSKPAVSVLPFGSAALECQKIGTLI